MALTPGVKLGPYEILAPLGAGGMGEVYKAKDTRLDRTVAIKVLPSHLSDNARRKERFEREARAVSSLNHPHICALYDVGSEEGVAFMVMEHIEGETLADRLKKGALPLDQVLRYAIEIADALDGAHRQGVVHRDLKPGNVMLTKSGAKLLDFGLAKLADREARGIESDLPTRQKPLTAEGSILGTFQYMAPEQLEGREADARTDIFAFGTTLYEMATGHKAFEGKSQASLIAAIIDQDPLPISSLEPKTPAALDYLVTVCMSKDPDDRWQSARDLCRELKRIEEGVAVTGQPALASAAYPWPGLRPAVPLALGALVLGGIIAGVAVWHVRPLTPQPVVRFVVATLPEGSLDVAISPDGTRIVYAAGGGALQVRIGIYE